MDEFFEFEDVFGSNPNLAYDEATSRRIDRHRRSLEGELFIDKLLAALKITRDSGSYPPGSNQDLRNLYHYVISSESPDHHKHAVLYYLLRDISQSSLQSPEKFAKNSYLPDKYKTFIDGIWYLDRLKFEKALDYLTEPALIPTFPDKILYTLCCHTSQNDVTLPIAYYQSVSPAITESKVLEAYFLILCRASVTEAFYFSRTQGDINHSILFEKLVLFVHTKTSGADKAARGVELISLPLTEEEENWFTGYLTKGDEELAGAADTLRMREVATGHSINVQLPAGNGSEKIDGVNWETLKATAY